MRRKTARYVRVVIVAILLLLKISGWFVVRSGRFMDTADLFLNGQVKCRMNCRHISVGEIRKARKDGTINSRESGIGLTGNSTFALEGYGRKNQHLSVVVAPEIYGLVIIACIDPEA